MRSAIHYLDWVRRFHGRLPFDLAGSGMPQLSATRLAELLDIPEPSPDDVEAPARFRSAIAERYEIPPDEVALTLGASGGIFATYAALLAPGDEVLVEAPTYEPLKAVAEGLGARVERFERPEERGFALDPDAVLRRIRPATRLVALTNPHNPSAMMASDDCLKALARALLERGVQLVVDEVYRELVLPRTTARTLGSNVIVQSSLTKAFGLGWARAGFLLADPKIAERAAVAVSHAVGMLPPSLSSYGAATLTHADRLHRVLATDHEGKREIVEAFAREHRDTLAFTAPPKGSIFGFFRDRRGSDLRAAIEAGAEREGVLVGPGSFFDYPSGFRVGLVAPRAELREGLERLARILDLR